MKISSNIRELVRQGALWQPYRNCSYTVQMQLADPAQVYNVPKKAGVVYNLPEDAYEEVPEVGYVVTGLMGEMWVIPPKALAKYDIDPTKLTHTPQPVRTVETDAVYLGMCVPAEIKFSLVVNYGREVILRGNRDGVPHGDGDRIIVLARREGNRIVPLADEAGRIVNGSIFERLYQPYVR